MHALQLSPAKTILPRPLSAPSMMCFKLLLNCFFQFHYTCCWDGRPAVSITAVVDPLSRSAQKLSTILPVLRKSINCDVKIVLNPKSKLSEVPLKSFYRYVAKPHLQFDINGEVIENQAR
uniref:DAGKc domain-containing protein n=1 Tax=Haemonchus placei TaxID=6290 RepID=A0A0N4X7Z9_HAEPC